MGWVLLSWIRLMSLCVIIVITTGQSNAISDDETEVAKKKIFLAPKAAKTFLRVRRGWKIKSVWGEEEEEEEEDGERRREAAHRAYIARTCPQQCWGGWSAWTSCSIACGTSGSRSRSRRVSPPRQCATWVRQHSCPGNSRETQACNRRCFNGGSLRTSNCACRAGFKGQCCQQRVTCSYPGKPTNGEVLPSGSFHYYNTVARFSCNSGYRLVGSSSRTCQNSGSWSSSVPSCQIVNCGNPGVPSHGNRQGSEFIYGRSVLYSCTEGYLLKGSKTGQCEASGRWSHPRPTCISIRCPRPPSPSFGWIRLPDNTFRSVAQYGCDTGYHLEGSQRRTCQLNTNWDGTQPICKRITCSILPAPSNGFVSHSNPDAVVYGSKANFSCTLGFVLQGARERMCSGSGLVGTWTGSQPVCRAVNCGEPGVPSHGTKIGSDYSYPHSVSFKCLPGYRVNGQHTRITCQANGQWNAGKPTCSACPRNTYKIGVSADAVCTNCPAHAHTVSTASTGPVHCICNVGFTGPAGGPCGVVRCPALSVPSHATMSTCQRTVGDVCDFTCQSGYIRGFGSQTRECQTDATWSGVQPTCTACPRNTYRSNPTKCLQCPNHSHTTGTASELTDCLCRPGFQGPAGGPCIDVDECATTSRGGCQQTCVNTVGSNRCECDIPGYGTDPHNPHRCKAEQACQALAAPSNGGLVCAKEQSTNTDRCSVKCNAGFEHLDHINEFEECGPDSSWMWTHEINDSPVLPCVEQFFSGVQVEAEVAYFVTSCSMLTEAQKVVVREQFVQMLKSRGICPTGQQSDCEIDDVTIRCGEEDHGIFRRKRSIHRKKLQIKFHIKVEKMSSHQRPCRSCAQGSDTSCLRACSERYQNEAKNTLNSATAKLRQLFRTNVNIATTPRPSPTRRIPISRHFGGRSGWSRGLSIRRGLLHRRIMPAIRPNIRRIMPVTRPNINTLRNMNIPALQIGSLILMPAGSANTTSATTECGSGMATTNGICVPCPPGTFLTADMCVHCPSGEYQPHSRQTNCLPCPRQSPIIIGAIQCVR